MPLIVTDEIGEKVRCWLVTFLLVLVSATVAAACDIRDRDLDWNMSS